MQALWAEIALTLACAADAYAFHWMFDRLRSVQDFAAPCTPTRCATRVCAGAEAFKR